MKYISYALIATCTLSLAPVTSFATERAQNKNTNRIIHTCKSNDSPVEALACNVYWEARGENINGQLAVGFVTINRLRDDNYPGSVRRVVYQPFQFSWTLVKGNYKIKDEGSWSAALGVSKFLYSIRNDDILYRRLDSTGGATHFHTKKVKPTWARHFTRTTTIESHVFYKPKNKGEGR